MEFDSCTKRHGTKSVSSQIEIDCRARETKIEEAMVAGNGNGIE